ncbi:MAG TPA: hypothetical protein VIB55_07535, partial [Longimicrobium sp.]
MSTRYGFAAAVMAATMLASAPCGAQAGGCGENGRGVRVADLGFTGMSGAPISTRISDGRAHTTFEGEPRISGARANGPLRDGDVLVAVDGQLITTREGGRRYSSIDPGERVRLSVRRGGRVQDV